MFPRKEILNIKAYQPGRPIEEVQRELGLKDVIKMASNENALGPSPKAVEAIKSSLKDINRYPDGSCFYLKRAIAKKLKIKEERIIVGNGSDELVILALRAFLNPNDEVIVARPTFLIYEIASRIQGARIKIVPMKDFRYDLRTMRQKISKKTKFVFIANPDNPVGTYVTKKELGGFLQSLPEGPIVFLDEAYFEFVERMDYPNGLEFLDNKGLIVTRSFSKAYGLAGLRLGYGISSLQIIKYMNAAREPFNVNSLAQAAGIAALEDREFIRKTKKLVREGRRFLYSEFERLGLRYIPSVTNFILFEVGKNTRPIAKKLLGRGVIVRDMGAWGLKNFIRVTIGTAKENKRFIEELKRTIV